MGIKDSIREIGIRMFKHKVRTALTLTAAVTLGEGILESTHTLPENPQRIAQAQERASSQEDLVQVEKDGLKQILQDLFNTLTDTSYSSDNPIQLNLPDGWALLQRPPILVVNDDGSRGIDFDGLSFTSSDISPQPSASYFILITTEGDQILVTVNRVDFSSEGGPYANILSGITSPSRGDFYVQSSEGNDAVQRSMIDAVSNGLSVFSKSVKKSPIVHPPRRGATFQKAEQYNRAKVRSMMAAASRR